MIDSQGSIGIISANICFVYHCGLEINRKILVQIGRSGLSKRSAQVNQVQARNWVDEPGLLMAGYPGFWENLRNNRQVLPRII